MIQENNSNNNVNDNNENVIEESLFFFFSSRRRHTSLVGDWSSDVCSSDLQYRIPATLITDNAAGWLMREGKIDRVIVGADRIAANGDTANKIGTYTLAVLAQRHGLPFYVAAPLSTFDPKIRHGSAIPIEERAPEEVTGFRGMRWAPEGIGVRNPAFDVTPAGLITAIICEKAVIRGPSRERLQPLISTSV